MADTTNLRTQVHRSPLGLLAVALLALPATAQVEVGDNDFKISSAANMASIHDAEGAAVAHNPNDGEYLVVWSETAAILASSGTEIIDRRVVVGRLVDAATGSKGSIVLISTSNNAGREAFEPAVVYNSVENEYLVVWWEDDGGVLAFNEHEIFGQVLSSNLVPVGGNFRISDMGGTGNGSYQALQPAVAFNSVENEYLVVWWGDDNVNGLVDGEFEIFGQRLNENGSPQGTNDFRISDMGGTGGDEYAARRPAISYNSVENEYLVVWHGTETASGLNSEEVEIYGQRLNENGTPQGTNDFRISDAGGLGDPLYGASEAAVAFNSVDNEYLVVWQGTDDVGGLDDGELEIFGQRLDENGAPQGSNDFRISDAGGTGNPAFDAITPAVAFNAVDNEFVVVWRADDNVDGLIESEFEIFGQRVGASGTQLGTRDFRISDMGGTGNNPFDASLSPAVAFSAAENDILVVWHGDDDIGSLVDGDHEIYGQRIDVAPIPLEVLLEVDLSVVNQITISATDGDAAASVFGSDLTGIYLSSFFTGENSQLTDLNSTSGQLAPALNTSDGGPVLSRTAGGADPGLNVYDMTVSSEFQFATGSLAFTGTATWTVSSEVYAALLTNGGSGQLFAPALSLQGLPFATKIGLWAVQGSEPEIFSDGFESGNTSAW